MEAAYQGASCGVLPHDGPANAATGREYKVIRETARGLPDLRQAPAARVGRDPGFDSPARLRSTLVSGRR